jgi:hypothetical protein
MPTRQSCTSELYNVTSTSDLLHIELSVPSDDPLQHERLTRALRDKLADLQGANIDWVEGATPAPNGTKAVSMCETVILAVSLGRVVVPPLMKVIESWLKTRTDQVLVVEHEGSKFELRGSRSQEDVELIRKLLER